MNHITMSWPAIFLLLAGLPSASPAAADDRPNVLFIAIDDLNDWVGFLKGHPQTRTPNMDRIAARGVVFTNAHCAAPLCVPSRAAVFSGRQPFRSGVYDNDDDIRRISPHLILLPTQFKAHGYRTYGAGKLLHRHRPDLFDDSFRPEQRWSPFTQEQVAYTPAEFPSKGTGNPQHIVDMGAGRHRVILPLNRMPSDQRANTPGGERFDWGPVDVPDEAMGDTQIVDWAIGKMAEKSDAPFFLGVGFYRPHIPLFAPARYFAPFPVDSILLPDVKDDDLNDVGATGRTIALDPETAGLHATVVRYRQWKAAVAAYLACVHFVDAQIGRLIAALEASTHAADTVIVLWGDHGWHLGEKQHWGKWTGWERANHVPLAIIPPARDRATFAGGASSEQPVSLIDLYPTLVELCGVTPPATGLDGRSLVPLLREPRSVTGRAVISTFYGEHFSVRDERWRYVRYGEGSEELYDHQTDPHEFTNVAGEPERFEIKKRLAAMIPSDPVVAKSASLRKED